jgi:transcriptional regulator with XRE-family HTH domain
LYHKGVFFTIGCRNFIVKEGDFVNLNYELVGIRIKNIRLSQKLTQEGLAEICDISPQHISHIENSGTKLSLSCLVSICNALKTTPNDVLMDSVQNNSPQLLNEVASVFEGCAPDEIYLMLSQAENLKMALKLKKIRLARE